MEPKLSASTADQGSGLVAGALELERAGSAEAAAAAFVRASDVAGSDQAVVRECARFFKRTGDYERAFDCYSRLRWSDPAAIDEFLYDLPPAELVRYAPLKVHGERPEPWDLWPFKAAMIHELGPAAAATTIARLVNEPWGVDLSTARLTSLEEFSKVHSAAHETLFAPRRVVLPAPPVFGNTTLSPVTYTSREIFFSLLEDVVVTSKSRLLLTQSLALFDFQGDELEQGGQALDLDPVVFAAEGSELMIARPRRMETMDAAVCLVGVDSSNFGHWLIEHLPRVLACRERPGFDDVPTLIDAQMPPQHRETLEILLGVDHPIRTLAPGEAVRVRSLWTCSTTAHFPLGPLPRVTPPPEAYSSNPDAFAALVSPLAPLLDALQQEGTPRRIFLSRRDGQHRQMVNRPEVEAWFADQDFEIFDFGSLPFEQQIRLVRGADVIVGPEGSSLAAAFFARPGTRVGIFTNPFLNDLFDYSQLFASLGHSLSILTGDVVRRSRNYFKMSSYQIDPAVLPEFFDDLLAA